MKKELADYKQELIKNGYLVFKENGDIKDLKTKKELYQEINTENIIYQIQTLQTQQKIALTGKINLVCSLNSINKGNKDTVTSEVAYISIKDNTDVYIKGYIEINKFIKELQNKGYMINISKLEKEQNNIESKRKKLINSINDNSNLFEGYKISIKQKQTSIEMYPYTEEPVENKKNKR